MDDYLQLTTAWNIHHLVTSTSFHLSFCRSAARRKRFLRGLCPPRPSHSACFLAVATALPAPRRKSFLWSKPRCPTWQTTCKVGFRRDGGGLAGSISKKYPWGPVPPRPALGAVFVAVMAAGFTGCSPQTRTPTRKQPRNIQWPKQPR